MMKRFCVVCLLALCGVWVCADEEKAGAEGGANWRLEQEVKGVILRNFAATEAGSVEGIAETLHTKSPAREASIQVMTELARRYKLRAELLEFRLVGVDGDYAIARGKQKICKVEGPEFRDSVVDSLYVFRKESGEWKLWQQCALETELL